VALPPLADRPVAVAGEHPGQPLADQLVVDDGVTDFNEDHGPLCLPAISITPAPHLGTARRGGATILTYNGHLTSSWFHCQTLARIMHETPSRDREDGRATGQPQGLGPEAYFFTTLQGSRPEDARKDSHIRGRSRWFAHNAR
jgi:hypothetical protein